MHPLLLFFLSIAFSFGQEYELKGVVTDDSNQPLPGVSITIKTPIEVLKPTLMESFL